MKIPKTPPGTSELFAKHLTPEVLSRVMSGVRDATVDGRYLHWDRLKYYTPPVGLSLDEWWVGLKLSRLSQRRELPLRDKAGRSFSFSLAEPLPKTLHEVDFGAGGSIRMPELAANPETRREFLVRSLIEEAFTSSQLEGAGTTRDRAKEIIRRGRPPQDQGERMVLNNYRTMEHIIDLGDRPMSCEVLFRIHRLVTEGTLDDPSAAGRLRRDDEYKIVGDNLGEVVYHEPPAARELEGRMAALCAFANDDGEPFIHPAIRSMILHFWLAYDHPFVDGNGRTARALFYWSMLRHEYWLFKFISISKLILNAPMKYERAFLETETDDCDLTYFLRYHADLIRRATDDAHAYIRRKSAEIRSVTTEVRDAADLNYRQKAALVEAVRHPDLAITVEGHRRTFGVSIQTARNDLIDLVGRDLMRMEKAGRAFTYRPTPSLESTLKRLIRHA